MLLKLISEHAGPLKITENPGHPDAVPGAWQHGLVQWDRGNIRLQYHFPEHAVGVLLLELKLLRQEQIEIGTRAYMFSLLFVFGQTCRLRIQGSTMILQDRGSAGYSGTNNNHQLLFQKEISYLCLLIQYPEIYFDAEPFEAKTGFLYPCPVIINREMMDDLSTLLFSPHSGEIDQFVRQELCRAVFQHFTGPHLPRLFQPAGRSLDDYDDFYRQRSQLLQQVTRMLPYRQLLNDAGIRDHFRFRKTSKALYGLNTTQWITEARVSYAVSLLKNQALSIKEIAYQSGFPSTAYFDRVFVHYFGVPPKIFRKG